jgi:exodeoxyribonuclease III
LPLTVATWNINSLRLRLSLLARFARSSAPDVICLQETKVTDDLFPRAAIERMGYPHIAFRGEKSYNGVAILSRVPFESTGSRNWFGRTDCRHIQVQLQGGIELHNFYVPAGGDVADPKANPKFAHKLGFLSELEAWSGGLPGEPRPRILVGDLNIAPLPNDVWSHSQLLDVVSHTPVETEGLTRARQAGQWRDAVRHFVPAAEKIYSWWSYRAQDWLASDRGRRLDHIWVSPELAPALRSVETVKRMRGWKLASDHVPVQATLAL